jgi:hypothetical protein
MAVLDHKVEVFVILEAFDELDDAGVVDFPE